MTNLFSFLIGNRLCHALVTAIVVDTKELEPLNLLQYCPVDENGGGSVLLFLYSLFTHDCKARHDPNTIIKFADDRGRRWEEVRDLTVWCQDNNPSLNVIKTKEMIVDYRKRRTRVRPLSHRQGCSGPTNKPGPNTP